MRCVLKVPTSLAVPKVALQGMSVAAYKDKKLGKAGASLWLTRSLRLTSSQRAHYHDDMGIPVKDMELRSEEEPMSR